LTVRVRTQLLHCTVATHICVNSVLFSCCAIRLEYSMSLIISVFVIFCLYSL
jgi:hypothetical protein